MYDELLSLADAENQGLRAEIGELREQVALLQQALAAQGDENARLFQRLRALEPPTDAPLRRLRIAIIGHPSRETDYRQVIERLGGELCFAGARDKLGQIDRAVQRAHGTLYLTPWGSHKASQRARDAATRYSRPFILSEQVGLATVEQVVLEQLLPQIRPDGP